MVVEYVDYSPEFLKVLKTLSKVRYSLPSYAFNLLICWQSFRDLLQKNEATLSRRISARHCLIYTSPITNLMGIRTSATQVSASPIAQKRRAFVASTTCRENGELLANTFLWLSECYFRKTIGRELRNNDIMSFDPTDGLGSQSLPYIILGPFEVLLSGLFKRQALALMFQLADCSAGLTRQAVREAQEQFIKQLPLRSLVIISIIVRVISSRYIRQGHGSEELHDPEEATQLRKEKSIFEDRLLRYGPFFLWAYIGGSKKAKDWMNIKMHQGMEAADAYERGLSYCNEPATPSLQSVLHRSFCEKVGCAYDECFDIIGRIMVEMVVKGV